MLFGLWVLLATWAKGSQRMRYLWERRILGATSSRKAPKLAWDKTYTMSLGSSLVSGGGLMRT